MANPLVTVAVISYNAVEYIIETLDSIKFQTYQNIELIIADDASPDETVEICEKWLKANEKRFVRTKLIASQFNGGVTVNCNRALEATQGEWLKIIGSDDVLFPDAVEKMMKYASDNKDATFMYGNQVYFDDYLSNKKSYKKGKCKFLKTCFGKGVSARDQYHILTKTFFGCAASSVGKTSMLREIGGFDERWPVEDWPLYINITKNGFRIFYIDDVLVYRRMHNSSIMHERDNNAILSRHSVKDACGGLDYLYENSGFIWKRFYRLMQWLNYNIVRTGNDKRNWKCRFWRVMAKYCDPYNYYYAYLNIKERMLTLFD